MRTCLNCAFLTIEGDEVLPSERAMLATGGSSAVMPAHPERTRCFRDLWGYDLHFVGDSWDEVKCELDQPRDNCRGFEIHESGISPKWHLDLVAARLGHRSKASGEATTPSLRLNWTSITAEDFERLLFVLVSEALDYENPEWLQRTDAPDRGRDLAALRVETDSLGGTRRYRTIFQCKHWLSRSIGPGEIATARTQMELWQPPRIDALVVATTGRFTADAIALVEKHNQADKALHIALWPESHLEALLAARPHLLAHFQRPQRA